MLNCCLFLGNFVRDPELKETQSGLKVLNFTLGINRRFKRGEQMVSEPAFLDCEAWDSGAVLIAEHFKKGDPIIVQCSVKQENWDDKNTGEKRSKLKFRVNQFNFVPGNKKDGNGGSKKPAPQPEPEPAGVGGGSTRPEEDIPF